MGNKTTPIRYWEAFLALLEKGIKPEDYRSGKINFKDFVAGTVVKVVAEENRLDPVSLIGHRTSSQSRDGKSFKEPRQEVMFILSTICFKVLTLKEIGWKIRGQDHCMVVYSREKTRNLIDVYIDKREKMDRMISTFLEILRENKVKIDFFINENSP